MGDCVPQLPRQPLGNDVRGTYHALTAEQVTATILRQSPLYTSQ